MSSGLASNSNTCVSRVDVRVLSSRYEIEFHNPHLAFPEKHAVLVFVTTEDGVVGVGESWCDGGDPATVVRLIESDLVPRLLGADVTEPARIWQTLMSTEAMSLKGSALYAAMSGVDIALWDAYSRSVGLPLYKLLGGYSNRIPVYGSAGLYAEGYTVDKLASDMAAGMNSGCCGAKIKVAGASVEEDEQRVAAVRQAIGSDARLMVDALFKPDVTGATALGKAVAPFAIYFYEAPTDRNNVQGWTTIRRDTALPLSGPEVESGLHRFREYLVQDAVDYLQADAIICGGITALGRIAALSQAFFKPLTYHASGSAIAFAANCHVAAAFAGTDSVEMHLLHQALFEQLWSGGWQLDDGHVRVPELPGLGIELNPEDPAFKGSGK